MPKILVADDDVRLADLVRQYLEREGHEVLLAHDGRRALELARQRDPDLLLLDLMMPSVDGWDVCRILRAESDVPIIMVTAMSAEDDTLLGLDLGADDYITKPFSPREVVARVRAVLRRRSTAPPTGSAVPLVIDDLVIDPVRHEVRRTSEVLDVTPKEFELLRILAAEPGRVFSRGDLMNLAFGFDSDAMERTVDVHIRNLRQKLDDDPKRPRYIETVYGVGYRMRDDL